MTARYISKAEQRGREPPRVVVLCGPATDPELEGWRAYCERVNASLEWWVGGGPEPDLPAEINRMLVPTVDAGWPVTTRVLQVAAGRRPPSGGVWAWDEIPSGISLCVPPRWGPADGVAALDRVSRAVLRRTGRASVKNAPPGGFVPADSTIMAWTPPIGAAFVELVGVLRSCYKYPKRYGLGGGVDPADLADAALAGLVTGINAQRAGADILDIIGGGRWSMWMSAWLAHPWSGVYAYQWRGDTAAASGDGEARPPTPDRGDGR